MVDRPQVSLNPVPLLDAAARATGLTDLGGAWVERRVRKMVALADMTPGDEIARTARYERLLHVLIGRLRFVNDERTYPQILSTHVERPLIVMGMGRSGTTLLQSLLAMDQAARTPRYWEVTSPSPPPSLSSADDERIAAANGSVADMLDEYPGLLSAHPYLSQGGLAPVECESFWETSAYLAGFLGTETDKRYQFHRLFLQHLQYRSEGKHWVLKGTEHQWHLPTLRATYPDAMLVWIHRDPVRVLASMVEFQLLGPLGSRAAGLERADLAGRVFATLRKRLDRTLSDPELELDHICHVLYRDLIADPTTQIGKIYAHFGLPFGRVRSQLEDWLASPERDPGRHGTFSYPDVPDGLDRSDIEEAFASYRSRFHIPVEQ